MMGKPY